jgi:hypothetical protein
MGAKQKGPGRVRVALARMLGEAGYNVDPQDIRQRKPGEISYERPLWSWEVTARRRADGAPVTIQSWNTMGACASRGMDDPAVSVIVRAR